MAPQAFDVVILAAGQGKRLQPVTYGYPKAMIRILEKPLLEWAVEGLLESLGDRLGKIVLVVGFEKEKIVSHFKAKPYAKRMAFVEQTEQLGTGDALRAAASKVSAESFFVLNGDAFFDPSLYSFLLQQVSKGPYIVAKQEADASSYGVLVTDESEFLRDLVEKPANSENRLVSTGTLLLPKHFFSYLDALKPSPRGELELTDALLQFAQKEKLKVISFPGFWTDVGYFWNYLHASEYALAHLMPEIRQGTVEDFVVIKGKLHLGKGSIIKSGTYIEGDAYVGEDAIVGPNAYLRKGVVIERNCHVGNSTELKASIVMRDSNAAHLSYVGDSILCEDVNLGAGTKIANLKFDASTILITLHGLKVDSKRNKLGAVVGKGTKTGVNASINCGVLIGEHCRVFPNVSVFKNQPSHAEVRE